MTTGPVGKSKPFNKTTTLQKKKSAAPAQSPTNQKTTEKAQKTLKQSAPSPKTSAQPKVSTSSPKTKETQKTKKLGKTLTYQLKQGKAKFDLIRIEKGVKRAATQTKQDYQLPLAGGVSANPVAKIGMEYFIPLADMKSRQTTVLKTIGDMQNALMTVLKKVYATSSDENSIQEALKSINLAVKSKRPSPQEFFKTVESALESCLEKPGINSDTINTLRAGVKNLDETISLKGVPVRYEKDAVLSTLRALAPQSKGIAEVKMLEDPFIDEKSLQKALGKDFDMIKKNQTPYVSSMEVLAHNDYRDSVGVRMQKILTSKKVGDVDDIFNPKHADRPEYAFKLGYENHREILAGKLAQTLGLEGLFPKVEHTFAQGKLGTTEAPSGIASQWLTEGEDLDLKALGAYTKAKHELASKEQKIEKLLKKKDKLEELKEESDDMKSELKELEEKLKNFSKEDKLKYGSHVENDIKSTKDAIKKTDALIDDLENWPKKKAELKANLDKATATLMKAGPKNPNAKTVNEQAFLDLLFMSYDSHAKQYKIVDGNATCIDFARFLAPGVAYTKMHQGKPQTCITLKSTFLDHPACDQKMPESLVNTIKDLKFDEIPVGKQKFFDDTTKQLNEIGDTLTKIKKKTLSKDEREKLMEKFGTKTDPELTTALRNQQAALTKKVYETIHPKAFALMKGRLSKMKAYLSKQEKEGEVPTLKGMFAHSEPELALVTRLFERVEERPCSTLAMGNIKGVFRPRSLEEASKRLKKSISKDERKQLKKAITTLQKTACKESELCTTMDL